ncbi:DNA polymerase [Anaerotruncus massiliensis (ex Liu et al. 2021)]|uniref:DNA polymerase n=1 Tax=Anaerotruncus massiliensis (ex Liu et al. 2021) TaxID=2321404 RepID=UPI003AB2036D
MRHMSVDIETYSSVPIGKAGMYKYAQSPDFEILLFAYSADGGPVEVIDLTGGGGIPQEVQEALFDPETIKHAYNAAFEWYCLSRYFRIPHPEAWLPQWSCTMLHSLYCGYPASLDASGKALGLDADKAKLATGKALIRYFCVPCKPTKVNGGRTRNLPKHDTDKWELFIEYNRQDVVTEMEIERRLSRFPVPNAVRAQWVTDQTINTRGVAVDTKLVEGALWCGDTVRESLMSEASGITGLANPNSLPQVKAWLEEETGEETPDLRKDTVTALLERDLGSDRARRMLEIRRELGKTSTKKYDAMAAAACGDGHIRGLMQFYGANRTGRWAGRIVQPQNLPRTYLPALPLARELVGGRRLDALRFVYGGVPDTLSQLIRTAFVASPGNLLVDADFSAIEARVIAWLAGEEWVLEVFRTHGKIYEACAAQMFGVPIETIAKGGEHYDLRQKGKVATLALGYQGGPGALIAMGALNMGLTEDELPETVRRWRAANRSIVSFWYDVEGAAISAIQNGKPVSVRDIRFARECDPADGLDFLTILLPSGRKLYYAYPAIGTNRFGRESITYRGMNQVSRKWETTETYGGKLAENITQAVARDCLAEAIERLEAAGYPVVFHVHDEVVIDCPADRARLEDVVRIMVKPPAWANGLPMGADGWVDTFYKKE